MILTICFSQSPTFIVAQNRNLFEETFCFVLFFLHSFQFIIYQQETHTFTNLFCKLIAHTPTSTHFRLLIKSRKQEQTDDGIFEPLLCTLLCWHLYITYARTAFT